MTGRQYLLAIMCICAFSFLGGAVGMMFSNAEVIAAQQEELRVKGLVITDNAGRERASIRENKDGVSFEILDEKGIARLRMGHYPNHSSSILLSDSRG